MHAPARRHIDIRNTFQFQKWFQQLEQMPQKCPCPSTNPPAQTVYPLQGGKVHPNFENKKNFSETRKIRWIHWWNRFLNPLTIRADICIFVTAVSALSNRSLRSVYNYAHRPILRTGQHLPCAAFSSLSIGSTSSDSLKLQCSKNHTFIVEHTTKSFSLFGNA